MKTDIIFYKNKYYYCINAGKINKARFLDYFALNYVKLEETDTGKILIVNKIEVFESISDLLKSLISDHFKTYKK